jgi:carboxymethylenebutenolidase
MTIYEPDHVEYVIATGNMRVVLDDGRQMLGYWSHPDIGGTFPGIALVHDWWGITDLERRLAQIFAQMGYYVIVPDLFNGQLAHTPQQAMMLVEQLGLYGYALVDSALEALEEHARCNGAVAAVGLGMGGSLAFESAVKRADIEAVVAYYGFPNRYLKRIKDAHVPILAMFGTNEPYIAANVISQLKSAFDGARHPHELVMLEGVGRDFFNAAHTLDGQAVSKKVLGKTLQFLDQHLIPRQQKKRLTRELKKS